MWIVRLALSRPYTFVVLALLVVLLGIVSILRSMEGELSLREAIEGAIQAYPAGRLSTPPNELIAQVLDSIPLARPLRRTVAGPVCESDFNCGTFGGGGGGCMPNTFTRIHLPRCTGDVRFA